MTEADIKTEPADFPKWNNPTSIFGAFHYHFEGYQYENLKLVEPG